MDWTQATMFERVAVSTGVLVMGLLCLALIYAIGCLAANWLRRAKRKRKTTRALKCELCENAVDGRCELFGMDVMHAPVRIPGCSWGTERKVTR